MKITARCHPRLEALLPKPVSAAKALPDWLGKMPGEAVSDTLGGQPVRTLKHCPPLIDGLRLGVLILCPTDITVRDGALSWAWDFPQLPDAALSRAPIGVHVPEQADGTPLAQKSLFVKFINHWTLQSDPGWSLLFQHPLGYPDLPFRTLSGVVDCDLFADGYVHFPAVLEAGFNGVIPKGTPIAQVIPVKKDCVLDVMPMTEAAVERNRAMQETLDQTPGHYRKSYRR